MRKKWVILSVALLGCLALLCFLFLNLCREKNAQFSHLSIKGSYFEPVEIVEFFSQIPCVTIRIDNKVATAKVDLGFGGDISLPTEMIQELDQKQFLRRKPHFGIRGKRYNSNVYELPKIKIAGVVFFRVRAVEIDPDFEKDAILLKKDKQSSKSHLGRVGWPLFHNFNFFMDPENSLIAFCDSLDTLREHGYPVDLFTETPLLLDRNFIEFQAMTEKGPIRCLLDTGSTRNMVNKDMEEGSNDHMIFNSDNIDQHSILNPENSDQLTFNPEDVYDISVFKVGKKEFGPIKFNRIKTPLKIDAVVGMEFLDSKLLFIDFPNRKIYFYEK